jgi:hypothetical protein
MGEVKEVDRDILRNIRDKYHEALNPITRWIPQWLVDLSWWLKNYSLCERIILFCSIVQCGVWNWGFGQLYRKLSLWDLVEVHEGKVHEDKFHSLTSSLHRSFGTIARKLKPICRASTNHAKFTPLYGSGC